MTEKEKIIVKQIERLEKRRNNLTAEISHQRSLLELICTHSEREVKEEYEEGSYYNKSEYHTYNVCKICGHKLLVHASLGSYV